VYLRSLLYLRLLLQANELHPMPVFLLQELNTNVIPAKKNKINDLAAFTIFDFAVPATNVLLIALAELVVFFMLFVL
jgi:hypothetical protein